jgi:hypothetical protein
MKFSSIDKCFTDHRERETKVWKCMNKYKSNPEMVKYLLKDHVHKWSLCHQSWVVASAVELDSLG